MDSFVAPTLGKLEISDVPTELVQNGVFRALVVSQEVGVVASPVHVTELWQARAWVPVLACTRCTGPARVLRAAPDGLLCGRCRPVVSLASRQSARQRRFGQQLRKLLNAARKGDLGGLVAQAASMETCSSETVHRLGERAIRAIEGAMATERWGSL